jgi:hypothetical protein
MQDCSQILAEFDVMHARARTAFEQRDLAACRDLFAPDLKYRQPDGRTIGRDALMRDVAAQFRRLSRVRSSFVRDHVEIGEDRATEILTQTGSAGVTAFFFVHRTWHLVRKGRYTWKRSGGRWRIAEVEVLEEHVRPGRVHLGFRPPPDD